MVVSTDGAKGKSLELSMGPSALSNKTYHFDKVFSSAADQAMIYDDVVTPILDEVSLVLRFHLFTSVNQTPFRCSQDTTVPYSHTDKRAPAKHIPCPET